MSAEARLPYRFSVGFACGAVLLGLGGHELNGWRLGVPTFWHRIPHVSDFVFRTIPQTTGLRESWLTLAFAVILLVAGSLVTRRGVLSVVRPVGRWLPIAGCLVMGAALALQTALICALLESPPGSGIERSGVAVAIVVGLAEAWLYGWCAVNSRPSLSDTLPLGEGEDEWFAWRLGVILHLSPRLEFEAREAMTQVPPPIAAHIQASSPKLLLRYGELQAQKTKDPMTYAQAYGDFIWELVEAFERLRSESCNAIYDYAKEYVEGTLQGVQTERFNSTSLSRLSQRRVAIRPISVIQLAKKANESLSSVRITPTSEDQAGAEEWIRQINAAIRPLVINVYGPTTPQLHQIREELQEIGRRMRNGADASEPPLIVAEPGSDVMQAASETDHDKTPFFLQPE